VASRQEIVGNGNHVTCRARLKKKPKTPSQAAAPIWAYEVRPGVMLPLLHSQSICYYGNISGYFKLR
jgi:hypothetical protein